MLSSQFRFFWFRPVLAAAALLLVLPVLSWFSAGTTNSRSPFSASAQNTSCTTSANQIIQTACNFPVIAQFEQAAVQGYLTQNNLPLTDAQYLYTYGGSELRNDIRAYMLELIESYADGNLSTLDEVQSNAYYWLQSLVQAEEKQYWAAAAAEYESWKASPCNYRLDTDVATAQGLSYDPTQWCYPNLDNYLELPPVPDQNYFLAVAWKKTYGALLGNSTQNATLLTGMQQASSQYAALYALPASFVASVAAGNVVAANMSTLAPLLGREFAVSAYRSAANDILKAAVQSGDEDAIASAGEVVQQAAQATQEDMASMAAEALETGSEVVGGTVIGIVIFAVETAVQAGIDSVNTQNTLDQIATLPAQAAQIAANPPSLTSMLGTQDGSTKASIVFFSTTLPDFPSPPDAAAEQNLAPGMLWVKEFNISAPALSYLDSSSKTNLVALRGGWFINQGPGATTSQLVGTINYLDWNGNARFATRVGPYQFLVYRQQPLSTDQPCPVLASNNDLSNPANPSQCYVYATNALQMKDANGNNITAEVVNPPSLTSPNYADFTAGQTSTSYLTFSSPVNDVPCNVTFASGILPYGVVFEVANGSPSFTGAPPANTAPATYGDQLTQTCGGTGGISTPIAFNLIIGGSNLQFTSPSSFSGVAGYSVNFPITTTGFPIPKLTASLSETGVVFTDNGNGTGTISWNPTVGYICPCPPDSVTASNGVQTITQPLRLSIASQQIQFLAPAQGSNLTFPAGASTTYQISTKGNFGRYPLAFTAAPSWLTVKDNGDGTGSISGAPPLGTEGTSSQLTVTANPVTSAIIEPFVPPSPSETFTISAVANPNPIIQLASATNPLAFVAGMKQAVELLANVSINGVFVQAGPLPPGLSFQFVPCGTNCDSQGWIYGTPAAGSGGDYKVPFIVGNPTSIITTKTLDIVVYDKPQLASSNRIIFYAGQPASSIVSATGFPLKPIGPFDDGIGYSGGAVFSDPTSPLPSFIKLTSGLGGAANGTATLTSSATSSELGLYPVSLLVQENAAPTPSLTDPTTQLADTFNLDVYVVPPGDANLDFKVNCADLEAVKAGFGQVRGAI